MSAHKPSSGNLRRIVVYVTLSIIAETALLLQLIRHAPALGGVAGSRRLLYLLVVFPI